MKVYLNEGIVLFVIALNGKNRFSSSICTDVHFGHLLVEEVGKILLVDVGGYTANVQTTGLTGKIRVASYAHAEGSNWGRRRQTSDAKDCWDLSPVCTRKIKETWKKVRKVSSVKAKE